MPVMQMSMSAVLQKIPIDNRESIEIAARNTRRDTMWLLRFLPEEQKDMITLGKRIVGCLDSSEERKQAIAYGVDMLSDGKVTVAEWAKFGSKLGILTGRSL